MASLSPETFLEVGHAMIGNLGTIMALLMPAAMLATLPVLYLLFWKRSKAFYPTLAAFLLSVAALLITLIVEVPIDILIEQWTVTSLPENWRELRDRWEVFHAIRTWISLAGFALLLAGALFNRDNTSVRRLSAESDEPIEQSLG
ncbi:MAG: anthrone oxygenase family protein [Pyrinomonadaceae bacterium]